MSSFFGSVYKLRKVNQGKGFDWSYSGRAVYFLGYESRVTEVIAKIKNSEGSQENHKSEICKLLARSRISEER